MIFKIIFVFALMLQFSLAGISHAEMQKTASTMSKDAKPLSLITATPEEGFQLAIALARKAVKATQPNKEILFKLREVYSNDADSLIAASQVVAIHFQTISAANNYWRDKK